MYSLLIEASALVASGSAGRVGFASEIPVGEAICRERGSRRSIHSVNSLGQTVSMNLGLDWMGRGVSVAKPAR